jgi:hypothetical protein
MSSKRLAKMLAATMLVAVTLSACGGDDHDDEPSTSNPEPPVTEQPKPPAPLLRCAP